MNLSSRQFHLLLASLVALPTVNANTEVFRCVDSNGGVEYRATRCDSQENGHALPLRSSRRESVRSVPDRTLSSKARPETYALSGDALVVTDSASGRTSPISLPVSFPSFSWPTGVALDTDLNIVTVVTKGGDGYLYRYDAARRQWLDYRSLKGLDLESLTYDPQRMVYSSRASDGASISISSQGELIAGQGSGRSAATFGTPVRPVNSPQLPLLGKEPPRELASNAELVVVSGYEASAQVTRVRLNRPGKRVLLLLSTYDKTLWRVEPSPGTTVSGIVIASFVGRSGVLADSPLPVYLVSLPYAYETDKGEFHLLLQQLNTWFGSARVDAFRGAYQLSSTVQVDAPDPQRPELTLRGAPAAAPSSAL